MTAKDLLREQFDDAHHQLTAVLSGLSEAQMDHRLTEQSMTAREQVIHLTEAYMATIKSMAGEKHQWGSYQPEDKSTGAVMAAFETARKNAVDGVLNSDHPKAAHFGSDYIVGHDYYHVGELCVLRMAVDPAWDAYSIYRH